jgi:hypothetical protein
MRSTSGVLLCFVLLTALLGGCAALRQQQVQNCQEFDAKRKQTSYATVYGFKDNAGIRPLSRGQAIAVEYELSVDTQSARPCTHVTIKKELTLARRADITFTIEESWEFYTEDGARITAKQENLTSQLRQSGRYVASVPLPIPRGAPPGKYYLISTLIAKSKAGTETLAKTSTAFDVVASQK